MTGNLIITTPKISMHPLAFQGIMVYTCYPQIRDMLMRRFGDAYVLLFAEPVENSGDRQIDWYSPVQGPAQKLKDLPEEDSAPIYDKLQQMAKDINQYADELVVSGEPLKVTRGNILRLALRYPDDDDLYVVGRQPVYTCWGFEPGTPGVEGKNLTKLTMPRKPKTAPEAKEAVVEAATPETSPAPVSPPQARSGCMAGPVGCLTTTMGCVWSFLTLIPFLLLMFLLLTSFGLLPALSQYGIFNLLHLDSRYSDEEREIARLESEIDKLNENLHTHVAMCESGSNVVIPPVTGGKEPTQQLVIPENAKDTSFLAGSWMCETGLRNSRTGEPIRFLFTFDKEGKGKGIVLERNDRCTGDAQATLEDGKLRLDLGKQECANSKSAYSAEIIECTNANSATTTCKGLSKSGSGWNAQFLKYE